MGVRIGRRVFDDGVHISERTLTTIGDDLRAPIQAARSSATRKRTHVQIRPKHAWCRLPRSGLVQSSTTGVTMGDGPCSPPDSFS